MKSKTAFLKLSSLSLFMYCSLYLSAQNENNKQEDNKKVSSCNSNFKYIKRSETNYIFSPTTPDNKSSTSYAWFVNGVNVGSGKEFSYKFGHDYNYEISLVVEDPANFCYNRSYERIVVDNPIDACNTNFYSTVSQNSATFILDGPSSSYSVSALAGISWKFGDGTVVLEEAPNVSPTQTHTYSKPGTYNVCITAIDKYSKCVSQICDSIRVYDTLQNQVTSINDARIASDKLISSLSLYPNPALKDITVAINSLVKTSVNVNIYDVSGKLVLSQESIIKQGINAVKFALSNKLDNGLYFVNIVDENNKTINTIKFVKQGE